MYQMRQTIKDKRLNLQGSGYFKFNAFNKTNREKVGGCLLYLNILLFHSSLEFIERKIIHNKKEN